MRFSQLARSAIPSISRSGGELAQTDLASLFEYHGQKGPKFRVVHSGITFRETGHLAALFMKECMELHAVPIRGRETQPVSVTIANLDHVPRHEEFPTLHRSRAPFYASVPILVSVGTCVACGCYDDWFSFSVILFGIIVNGISCLVIGSGTFRFKHPEPAPGSPPADGILGCDEGVVLLKGQEGAEKIQRDLLMKILGRPRLTKFILGTRTSMVAFVLLALDVDDPEDLINFFLPFNTRIWQIWKAAVIGRLRNHEKLTFDASAWDEPSLLEGERQMLETLFKDAQQAYEGFEQYRERILPCSKMQ
ncbi:hypothetical protein PISMIDRAFT_103357 [Pisolithus microcarpus 441]|uniref:Uncharacterized protein n=1 Tax=Pisolithus microcarpus 441 TaxID=765257 RepID=A0A0C9YAR6_9AGAM|nr:hypothetical protein PISMIDRAFT_103357 [Pisolithus microcarpus 441]